MKFRKSRTHQPTTATPPRSRRRRKLATFGLATAAVLGGGLFAAFAGAGYLYTASPTVRNVVHAVRHRDITPDKAFPGRDEVTFLVIGADQDRDHKKQVVGKAQRSDTLMVVRFDFFNERASIVSIPRDTKVRIPGYRGYQKINAAFAQGGAKLAEETVEGLLGVTIDDVVMVNFDGFKKVVDLLGGVPVTVDKPLHYDDNWGDLHVHLEPGRHVLNGEEALGFVRIRKVDSDTHRAARQQQFLTALKGRLSDPRVWLKVPAIVEGARGALETGLDDKQLLCLGAFLKNLPSESVQTATLPGHEGPSFVTLDPEGVREVARNLLAVEEAPLEGIGSRSDRYMARRERGETFDRVIEQEEETPRRARARQRSVERQEWREEAPVTDEFSAPLGDDLDVEPSVTAEEIAEPVRVREIAPTTNAPRSVPTEPGSVRTTPATPTETAPPSPPVEESAMPPA